MRGACGFRHRYHARAQSKGCPCRVGLPSQVLLVLYPPLRSVPISSPSARVRAHHGPCEQDRRALVAIDSDFLPASLSLDSVYPNSQQLRALHPPSAYPLSLFKIFQGQHEKPELCPLSSELCPDVRTSPFIMASWNDIVIILIKHSNSIYQPCPRVRECVC